MRLVQRHKPGLERPYVAASGIIARRGRLMAFISRFWDGRYGRTDKTVRVIIFVRAMHQLHLVYLCTYATVTPGPNRR